MTPRCWAWTSKKGVTVTGDEKTLYEELWLRCLFDILRRCWIWNLEYRSEDWAGSVNGGVISMWVILKATSQDDRITGVSLDREVEVCVSTWSPPTLEVKAWGSHRGVRAEAAREVGGPGEKSLLAARYLHRNVKEGRKDHLHQMPQIDTTRMKNWPFRCSNAKIVGDFRRMWDKKTWLK